MTQAFVRRPSHGRRVSEHQGAGSWRVRSAPPSPRDDRTTRWSGNVSISLTATTNDLKNALTKQTQIPAEGMKLLAAGKCVARCIALANVPRFLKDGISLADQGVKASTKILLLKVDNLLDIPSSHKRNSNRDKLLRLRQRLRSFTQLKMRRRRLIRLLRSRRSLQAAMRTTRMIGATILSSLTRRCGAFYALDLILRCV